MNEDTTTRIKRFSLNSRCYWIRARFVRRSAALWLPLFLSFSFLSFSLIACHQSRLISSNNSTSETVSLTVSAAASLQSALKDIQAAYETVQGTRVVYNFGASGALAQQIVQGAPVDVFLSASEDWMDELSEQRGILLASRKCFLSNSLVIVVPAAVPSAVSLAVPLAVPLAVSLGDKKITRLRDLPTDSSVKIAVGEPQSVPVGQYTKEALQSMGVLEARSPQLVFGKDARQVLAYVETENAAAGVVYATDALISEKVSVIERVPSQMHSPITYSVAVTRSSKNIEAAQTFLSFLFEEEAKTIFERYGFEASQPSVCLDSSN